MAAPGLQEGLLRDAEARRLRQQRREEEAEAEVQRMASPRLNPASNYLWQVRCAKELRRSFEALGSEVNQIPSDKLVLVLQDLGLLRGVPSPYTDEEDHIFVERLAKFLDQERSGYIQFALLLDFLTRGSEAEGSNGIARNKQTNSHNSSHINSHNSNSHDNSQSSAAFSCMAYSAQPWPISEPTGPTSGAAAAAATRAGTTGTGAGNAMGSRLTQECNAHLERQLLRSLSRRMPNRLSRPKGDPTPASSLNEAQHSSRMVRSTQPPSPKGRGSQPRQSSLTSRRPPQTHAPPSRPASTSSASTPNEKAARALASFSAKQPVRASAEVFCPPPREVGCSRMPVSRGPISVSHAAAVSKDPSPSPRGHSPCSARRASSQRSPRESGDDTIAAIRCDLLYHQALAVDKENSELIEKIRILRERECNFECTFHPNILPPRRPSPNPTSRPRNFDRTVARLRHAREEREALVREQCHVPVGENYERLRRLGQQPFACADREDKPWLRGPPLFIVEVEVGRGRTGRIGIYEGESLERKAHSFGRAFQLDQQAVLRLEDLLYEAYEVRVAGGRASQENSLRSQSATPSVSAFDLQESRGSPYRRESRSPSVRGSTAEADVDEKAEVDLTAVPPSTPRQHTGAEGACAGTGAGPGAGAGPGPGAAAPPSTEVAAATSATAATTNLATTNLATTTTTTTTTPAKSGPARSSGGAGGSALELLARRYGRNSPVQVTPKSAPPG